MEEDNKDIKAEKEQLKFPKVGEIVEGKIASKKSSAVFIDLGPFGAGIIYGKEFQDAKGLIKELGIGDSVFAKVTELENEDGYVELSLDKADKEMSWKKLAEIRNNDETIKIKIIGVNKGGLLAQVSDIPGFLPVSQLSAVNYPKVEGADKMKILKELQKFIGQEMEVKVFDLDPKQGKLILSEKAKDNKKIRGLLENFGIGDTIEGEITGIVDFGAFIKFPLNAPAEEMLEGLIHISELDWQLIENPRDIIAVGEKVKAKIIGLKDNKVFLSLKALKEDPWKEITEKYKKGDTVKGTVTKINPFGAFVQIDPKIQGLCHISEFGTKEKMENELLSGQNYDFKILLIEPAEHRMHLKLLSKEEN